MSEFLEGVPLTSSIEAEMSVLGSMSLSKKAASQLATYLRPWDFYRPAHRWLFETMKQMVVAGEEIDLVTLRAKLVEKDKLADCGGVDFLIEVIEYVPSAANALDYAKIVKDRAIRRKMHKLSRSVVDLATNGEKPTDQILLEIKGHIREIEDEEALGKSRLISIGEVVREIVDGYQDEDSPAARSSSPMPTGIATLDKYGVLARGGMMVVGGRPGMGKSSLGMTIAANIAETGKNVVIVSYEMPPAQLVRRLLAANSGISVKALSSKEAFLKIADLETHTQLMDGAESIVNHTVYFIDKPARRWAELEVQLLQAQAQLGRIDAVMIDYLQLMAQGTQYQASEISNAANSFKGFCIEHDLAGIGLAQLNREIANRDSKRPTAADLKGSGGLEEAPDSVVLIHRDSYYNGQKVNPSEPQEVELIVAKNRHGEMNVTARAYFIPEQTAFRSA